VCAYLVVADTVGRDFVKIRTAKLPKLRGGAFFDEAAIHVVTSDSMNWMDADPGAPDEVTDAVRERHR